MGFGGGEILTFAAGVCFYNNIRRVANDRNLSLASVEVEAIAETSGDPTETREVILKPKIESDASEQEIQEVVNQALDMSYVADMLRHSVNVELAKSDGGE